MMSSNVVCFLLLTKFRRGIKLKDLAIEMQDFGTRLNEKKIRLGFDGDSKHVINHVVGKALILFTPIIDDDVFSIL